MSNLQIIYEELRSQESEISINYVWVLKLSP